MSSSTLLNYAYITVFVLGTLVFFDLLFRFKRPLLLKVMLLISTFGAAAHGLGHVYCHYAGYNRWIMEWPLNLMAFSLSTFFYVLFRSKMSLLIILFFILLFLTQLTISSYYYKVHALGFDVDLFSHPLTSRLARTLKIIFIFVHVSFQVNLLARIIRKFHQVNIYFEGLRNWSLTLIGLLLFNLFAHFLKFIMPDAEIIGSLLNMAGYGFSMIAILYRPDFLNRTPLKISLMGIFSIKNQDAVSLDHFERSFFNELFYLKEKASIQELANMLDIKVEDLSGLIHRKFDMSFTDLVNKHRILYFIELVKQGKSRHLTIEALAIKSGFSSRQNMQRSFKKFHGGVPSDLVRLIDSDTQGTIG